MENSTTPEDQSKATLGQRIAEGVAATVGSWKFIIFQSCLLLTWVIINATTHIQWDPYPFILMNLFLSLQAAYTAPIILMAQNRLAERDRDILNADYNIDKHTNQIIRYMHDHLEWQDDKIEAMLDHLAIQTPPKPRPDPKIYNGHNKHN